MNKEEYVKKIIEAVGISNNEAKLDAINESTKFSEIPNMDSMSVVNFQIDLSTLIGDKANAATPLLEMTVGDYAELLESL